MENNLISSYKFNLEKTINRLVIVISIGIVAHLIFLLLTNDRNIFQYLHEIELKYVFLILLLLPMNWIGHGARLTLWTHYLKTRIRYKQGLKIAIYTELGQAITPTLIGGGPIKMALLIKNGLSTGKAGFLTLLGGFEDFLMYCIVFIVAFFHARQEVFKILGSIWQFLLREWQYIALGMFALIALRILFRRLNISIVPIKYREAWGKIRHDLGQSWHEMIEAFKKVSKDGFGYFTISFLILIFQWLSRFTVLIILLYALGIEFKPFQVYIQQWIVYLTMIFIPTPGATGGAEATFFLLFEKQIPKDLLPLITSTWRFFMYYMMLFTAVTLIQLFHIPEKNKANQELPNE
ncbi:MAG: flippase-like domain-containing protein [Saprospiraceae bacterium]|nr:flippase-like domain-containing protein [Saprospiraceae bacterium]